MPNVPVDYYITEGDFGKVMSFTVLGVNRQPVDLTGSNILFYVGDERNEGLVVNGNVAVADPDQATFTGVARYTWQAVDTLGFGGYWDGVFKINWGGGELLTFPTDPRLRILIKEALP